MKFIEIPNVPILRGQEAIDALNDVIKEFEEQKGKELTRKQAKAMIKFAKGLISSIEAEMTSEASSKNKPKSPSLFKKIEDVVLPRLQLFK